MLVEIVRAACLNLVPMDSHEGVSIGTALLMPQTHCMPYLVDRVARSATAGKIDRLLTALTTNI